MGSEYKKYLVEAGSAPKENQISKMIAKTSGIRVKNYDKKLHVVFHLSQPLDEEEFENFDKIDNTTAMLEKMYPGAMVSFDGWKKFTVEEL